VQIAHVRNLIDRPGLARYANQLLAQLWARIKEVAQHGALDEAGSGTRDAQVWVDSALAIVLHLGVCGGAQPQGVACVDARAFHEMQLAGGDEPVVPVLPRLASMVVQCDGCCEASRSTRLFTRCWPPYQDCSPSGVMLRRALCSAAVDAATAGEQLCTCRCVSCGSRAGKSRRCTLRRRCSRLPWAARSC
jgi:hypothetical protein